MIILGYFFYFSIKKRPSEALLMSTHNICFFMENWRKLSHNYHQILFLNNSSGTIPNSRIHSVLSID